MSKASDILRERAKAEEINVYLRRQQGDYPGAQFWQQRIAEWRAVAELMESGAAASALLAEILEHLGPCDHDVGICQCDDLRKLDDFLSKLAALEREIAGESDSARRRASEGSV